MDDIGWKKVGKWFLFTRRRERRRWTFRI